MIVPKYFEDLNVLHKNTMPNRAYYIPASVPMDLQPETRETSDRFLLLSGDWKFHYFENIYDVKEEFFQDGRVSGRITAMTITSTRMSVIRSRWIHPMFLW